MILFSSLWLQRQPWGLVYVCRQFKWWLWSYHWHLHTCHLLHWATMHSGLLVSHEWLHCGITAGKNNRRTQQEWSTYCCVQGVSQEPVTEKLIFCSYDICRCCWSTETSHIRFGLRQVTKATNGDEEKCFWDYLTTSRSVNYYFHLEILNVLHNQIYRH